MTTGSDLDRRITIERYTEVDDGHGGVDLIWAELAIVAASRHDVSDSERVAYGGIVSNTIRRFVIRAIGPQSSVSAVDQLRYDDMIWNILGVKETRDGRKRFLEITAKAGG
ncbi:phage head closure protein [Pararhizobium gei]|uniref:phage head closure protein n=1 Tax=Pararhizobium gei TaxID=1395951 RepID=UPI0023DA80F6|nr:phage head closure protein [Rhizobium gei]